MPRTQKPIEAFATDSDIAAALRAACRLTGTTPVEVLHHHAKIHERTRHVAFAAIGELYPDHPKTALARSLGYKSPFSAASNLIHHYTKAKWWNDVWVDDVVGSLVLDQYGDRAK